MDDWCAEREQLGEPTAPFFLLHKGYKWGQVYCTLAGCSYFRVWLESAMVTCSYCGGKGYDVKDVPGTSKQCPVCKGTGEVKR
jgi:hypothetical protein